MSSKFFMPLQQFFSIISYFKIPLRQFLLNNISFTMSPAFPIFNLFIRQNRITIRTPVYKRFFLINQSFFIHFNKEFLIPFVILWSVSAKFSIPIIRKTHKFQLSSHIVNVRFSPFSRMSPMINRRIFRR